MPINVTVPAAIRSVVGNQATVAIEGATVQEVVDALTTKYPELGKRIYDGDPAARNLKRSINLYVNDEDIRFLDNWKTALKNGDELTILLAIAGG